MSCPPYPCRPDSERVAIVKAHQQMMPAPSFRQICEKTAQSGEFKRQTVMPQNTLTMDGDKTACTFIDVSCTECERSTKHKVLASVQYDVRQQVVQCQCCKTTSFRIDNTNSDDYDLVDDQLAFVESVTLYPS